MKDIVDVLNNIKNKPDFIEFIKLLKEDFILHKDEWENQNIKDFF